MAELGMAGLAPFSPFDGPGRRPMDDPVNVAENIIAWQQQAAIHQPPLIEARRGDGLGVDSPVEQSPANSGPSKELAHNKWRSAQSHGAVEKPSRDDGAQPVPRMSLPTTEQVGRNGELRRRLDQQQQVIALQNRRIAEMERKLARMSTDLNDPESEEMRSMRARRDQLYAVIGKQAGELQTMQEARMGAEYQAAAARDDLHRSHASGRAAAGGEPCPPGIIGDDAHLRTANSSLQRRCTFAKEAIKQKRAHLAQLQLHLDGMRAKYRSAAAVRGEEAAALTRQLLARDAEAETLTAQLHHLTTHLRTLQAEPPAAREAVGAAAGGDMEDLRARARYRDAVDHVKRLEERAAQLRARRAEHGELLIDLHARLAAVCLDVSSVASVAFLGSPDPSAPASLHASRRAPALARAPDPAQAASPASPAAPASALVPTQPAASPPGSPNLPRWVGAELSAPGKPIAAEAPLPLGPASSSTPDGADPQLIARAAPPEPAPPASGASVPDAGPPPPPDAADEWRDVADEWHDVPAASAALSSAHQPAARSNHPLHVVLAPADLHGEMYDA